MISARLGKVTGRGLAGVLRCNYPRWILWSACFLLIVANIFNIGAGLGGMADVTKMMTGVSSLIWAPVYAISIVSLLFWTSYHVIVRASKWLTLVALRLYRRRLPRAP